MRSVFTPLFDPRVTQWATYQRHFHARIDLRRLVFALLVMFVAALIPAPVSAAHESYPLTSLYFVDCCFSNAEAEEMAYFDLIVLTMEAQEYNATGIEKLRTLNPNIKIIPYVPSQGIDFNTPSATRQKLIDNVQPDWYLIRPGGSRVSRYAGEYDMNITNENVRREFASFVGTTLNDARCGSVHCWDGVFYDVVEDNLDYLGPLDLDNDGSGDADINTKWVAAYRDLFARTRSEIGSEKLIIINGVSNESVQGDINGRMFENFPTPWHSDGTWQGVVGNIPTLNNLNMHPAGIILSGQGSETDYRKMRYSVISGVITGTYAGYDNGVDQHNSIWLYDEYKSSLGKAQGKAVNLLDRNNSTWKPGVWRREFDNGIAILNTSGKRQTISLNAAYEHLHGTQDPKHNNGKFTGTITLEADDGVILFRRLRQMDNAAYLNGAFAAVYDSRGRKTRTSFFPFDKKYPGSTTVFQLSDGDYAFVADKTYVTVYRKGKRVAKFAPYGKNFRGGVTMDVDTLEYPSASEQKKGKKKPYRIVTGTKSGGKHVRVFDLGGRVVNKGCFPYGSAAGEGVNVAIGEVLKSNKGKEIVVGVAKGGNSQLLILNNKCQIVHGGFMPYDRGMRSGVAIAVGDITGDGKDEIVTMPGAGASAHVRVFSEKTSRRFKSILPGFTAFSSAIRSAGGITIADLDHDGKKEIIPMTYGIFNF
jgi:hypothetical protein